MAERRKRLEFFSRTVLGHAIAYLAVYNMPKLSLHRQFRGIEHGGIAGEVTLAIRGLGTQFPSEVAYFAGCGEAYDRRTNRSADGKLRLARSGG